MTRATRILDLAASASRDADDAMEKRLRDIPYYGSAPAKVRLDLSLESLSAIRARRQVQSATIRAFIDLRQPRPYGMPTHSAGAPTLVFGGDDSHFLTCAGFDHYIARRGQATRPMEVRCDDCPGESSRRWRRR